MPLLSTISAALKGVWFLKKIKPCQRVLEIGSGSGWVREKLAVQGVHDLTTFDLLPPADIVGDIRDYAALGLVQESFDVIIAFELVEHVDCLKQCHELLRPGGTLMLTSPLPPMDPLLNFFEDIGLNQRRTTPHTNLTYFRSINFFRKKVVLYPGFMAQWGIFVK
ncbi:MAG: class I SAM-dependent methyltransferase [Desulfamplus sp.]|nr:class I SAM-dependent methyltransferase [Desulfamplus sp.]